MVTVSTTDGGDGLAPGTLSLVHAFANTIDVEAGTDEFKLSGADVFENAHQMRRWLVLRGLWGEDGPELTLAEYERLHRLRDAVRELLKANHGGSTRPDAALAAWNALTREGTLRVELDGGGQPRLAAAENGVDGVVAAFAGAAYDAMVAGTWPRLKICAADTCAWAFYDGSKNRSGTWCSMAICGNRAKVRKYQARRKSRSARDG